MQVMNEWVVFLSSLYLLFDWVVKCHEVNEGNRGAGGCLEVGELDPNSPGSKSERNR